MTRRNSLDGRLIVMFGGGGFLGTHLAQALMARGARLRIVSRNPEQAHHLKAVANLGQIQFAYCDVTRAQSVELAMRGADMAVNLAGCFGKRSMAVMAEGAANVARAAAQADLRGLVHISAAGADEHSEATYARAKANGESQVVNAFPQACIIRPSALFGEDDRFLSLFASTIAALPVVPIFAPQSRLSLLWVQDAAEAAACALEASAKYAGKIFEIAGPEAVSMEELHHKIAAAQQRSRHFINLPDGLAGVLAALPLIPPTRDQWIMLRQGDVSEDGDPKAGRDKIGTIADFGIAPQPLDLFLDRWMERYRKHGRFAAPMQT